MSRSVAEEITNRNMRKLQRADKVVMDDELNLDTISNLPWDVLDSILLHLPLKVAARTSVLSTKWKYKWTGMSQFVFDDKSLPIFLPYKDRWKAFKGIIDHIQENHTGPIEKFKLASCCQPIPSELDEWIRFLTEKEGLKELVLHGYIFCRRFDLRSTVFSCPQLSLLELYGCIIKLPLTFEGMNCLKSLKLHEVSISSDTLESLIRHSPVLEMLTLISIDRLDFVRIHNKSLKYLKIDSKFKDICFESTPLLVSVDIRMIPATKVSITQSNALEQGPLCNLDRVLGGLDKVEKLTFSEDFHEFLGNGGTSVRLDTVFNNLVFLGVKGLQMNNLKKVRVFFSILRNSPNLEELFMTVSEKDETSRLVVDFLKEETHVNFYLHQLKIARIRGINGSKPPWELLRFILGHSPVLESMLIVSYDGDRVLPESELLQSAIISNVVQITSLTL